LERVLNTALSYTLTRTTCIQPI